MKRVLLRMPGYGQQTAGAARALWRSTKGRAAQIPVDAIVSVGEGSLLAQNFNAGWCEALNHCLDGNRIDYFAMLHSDVEPEDFWLDTLIEELEACNLDVLGTVVPIKDPKGLTSIALDREDGDPWRPLCRLTLREIHRLPETFTSADLGHPLLLNTGCWVCRFDPKWAEQVFFTINDRIVRLPNRKYQAQVEPEDWFFSRLCHEMGLKIGCTRKVILDHVGAVRYTNREPWGQDHFDTAYATESIVPENSEFRFPEDVDGWLLHSEGKELAEAAIGKHVLEVGSYCGKSTICLAQTAASVTSVDPHDGRGTPKPRDTRREFAVNLNRYDLAEKVQVHIGTLADAAPELLPASFDLIFIDGAHDHTSVKSDIELALPLLAPGGRLAFHDYRNEPGKCGGWDPGVTQAVNELLARGGEMQSHVSTLAVIIPPQLQEASNGVQS